MSRDKQIEDMVKICHFHNDGICHLCEELLVSCDRKCDLAILVENLYAAGYRKASEVAEEIFAEIEQKMNALYKSVQYGCYLYGRTKKCDSLDAIRQVGKLAGVKHLGDVIAELKKKYESEKYNG